MLRRIWTAHMTWVREHSYWCSVCHLPRLFIRRDHMSCLTYAVEATRREEVERITSTNGSSEKKYTPRNADDPTRDFAMTAHATEMRVAEAAKALPADWRTRSLFDLSKCSHTQRQLVEVENEHGIWGSEICVNCGQQVLGPQCPHVSNHWNEAGTMLQCDNCGIDGT